MKYEYMKEYETNGEKPDLPDDVFVRVYCKSSQRWSNFGSDTVESWEWEDVLKFRIVDERYKPKPNDWHKRGELPPVGTECEYTKRESAQESWFKCEVIAFDGGQPVIKTEKGHYHRRSASDYLFRPIQSDRDKLVEKAKEICKSWDDSCGKSIPELLVDAGWRPIKQQGEDEFVQHCLSLMKLNEYSGSEQNAFCTISREAYRAGCRFIEQGGVTMQPITATNANLYINLGDGFKEFGASAETASAAFKAFSIQGRLTSARWKTFIHRKTKSKQQTEDEFVDYGYGAFNHPESARKAYRAGCRFVEQGEV